MSENWSDTGRALIDRLQTQKAAVIEQAIQVMCEHYQCAVDELTLNRTMDFPSQILQKNVPGLAYLIKLETDESSGRWIAEPIYLETPNDKAD